MKLGKENSASLSAAARRLADRAFQLARANGSIFPGPFNARKQMAPEFPDISTDPNAPAFFEAYERAVALVAEAERIAERIRDGRITEIDAERLLQETCGGYLIETYRAALAEGLFRTR